MIRDHGLMRDGDPATAICAEVAPSPDEPVIAKCGFGPFGGTNLEGVLHRAHPTELLMGGVTTNHVVESAVRHASDIGFSVVVLEDLCACDSAEAHRYAIQDILPSYAVVTTSDEYLRDRGWIS
jgi:nicotinamidase-related amidase